MLDTWLGTSLTPIVVLYHVTTKLFPEEVPHLDELCEIEDLLVCCQLHLPTTWVINHFIYQYCLPKSANWWFKQLFTPVVVVEALKIIQTRSLDTNFRFQNYIMFKLFFVIMSSQVNLGLDVSSVQELIYHWYFYSLFYGSYIPNKIETKISSFNLLKISFFLIFASVFCEFANRI